MPAPTNPAAGAAPPRRPTVRGLGVPPALVAFVRSLAIAAIVGALVALAHGLAGVDLTDVAPVYRPMIVAALGIAVRTLEGLADQLRGQARQTGPLGGAPANPLDYAIHTDDVNNAHPLNIAHAGAAILAAAPHTAIDWLTSDELHTVGQAVTGALASESRPPIDQASPSTPPASSPPVDDPIGAIVDQHPPPPAE